MPFAIRQLSDPEGGAFLPWDRTPSYALSPGYAPGRRPVARIELTVVNGRRLTAVHADCRTPPEASALAEVLAALLGVHAELDHGRILFHGDHRERLRRELKRKGYRVKG